MKLTKVLVILLIIAALFCAAGIAAFMSIKDSASIGIIGGADGPTAIFVTTNPSLSPILAAIAIIAVVIAIVLFLNHKRKQQS